MKSPTPKKLDASPAEGRTANDLLPIDLLVVDLDTTKRPKVLQEILVLEAAGATPVADETDTPAIEIRAQQLLAGFDAAVGPRPLEGNAKLHALRIELAAIGRAIELGRRQSLADHAQLAREIYLEVADDWREIIYQTAATVAALQQLNRARAALRRRLTGPGGTPNLPCDGFKLLGDGSTVGAEPYVFFQTVTKAGIVSAGEVEKWSQS
jgi:hypothetical protein